MKHNNETHPLTEDQKMGLTLLCFFLILILFVGWGFSGFSWEFAVATPFMLVGATVIAALLP